MPTAQPTQAESAFREIERLYVSFLRSRWRRLSRVLAEAQNSPPDGGSDRSINRERWTAMKAVETALFSLISALESEEDFDK